MEIEELEKSWGEEQGQAQRADDIFLRHLMPFWAVEVPACWQIPEPQVLHTNISHVHTHIPLRTSDASVVASPSSPMSEKEEKHIRPLP